ncbi:hypothetical protein PInf_010107 [Phytophthora infestans]|nr:hypothetical protein PInf_010107 [Phytophthora infestans]
MAEGVPIAADTVKGDDVSACCCVRKTKDDDVYRHPVNPAKRGNVHLGPGYGMEPMQTMMIHPADEDIDALATVPTQKDSQPGDSTQIVSGKIEDVDGA